MMRLTHRLCRAETEGLADTARRQTERAEELDQRLTKATSELRDTEHDLEVATERVSALVNQFARILEDAHESGMLYRTWALLDRTMGANDDGDHLYAALRKAKVPALGRAAYTRPTTWWLTPSGDRLPCPACAAAEPLLAIKHNDAPGRERMLCENCEHHWPLPAHLRPCLDHMVPMPGPHDPVRLLPLRLLAALDAAAPTADEHQNATEPAASAA